MEPKAHRFRPALKYFIKRKELQRVWNKVEKFSSVSEQLFDTNQEELFDVIHAKRVCVCVDYKNRKFLHKICNFVNFTVVILLGTWLKRSRKPTSSFLSTCFNFYAVN